MGFGGDEAVKNVEGGARKLRRKGKRETLKSRGSSVAVKLNTWIRLH